MVAKIVWNALGSLSHEDISTARIVHTKNNKPRTAKVGAISKAQNLKGGPFGLCETPASCKKFKKSEGGTLWRHEKISQKNF